MTKELIYKPDITLTMECSEDELSPVQILAYERTNKRRILASNIFNALNDKENIVYDNSCASLFNIYNNLTSRHVEQILPDDSFEDNSEFHLGRKSKSLENAMLQENSFTSYNLQTTVEVNNSTSFAPFPKGLQQLSKTSISHSCSSSSSKVDTDSVLSVTDITKNKEYSINLEGEVIHHSLLIEAKPAQILCKVRKEIEDNEQLYLNSSISVLKSYEPATFTEWLIQHKILPTTEQYCKVHGISETSRFKIKHDTHLNELKFLHSGGYVWVSDCCPNNYISILKGSLFEKVPHCPKTLIMLLYHWSCQTNIKDIIISANVNTNYLRTLYANLRGVCIAGVHEDCKRLLGGRNKMVEVGFISLGLGRSNEEQLHIKAWIIGVLDSDSKRVKMFVLKRQYNVKKPKPQENEYLLLPLKKLINKNSIILTDLQLQRHYFTAVGFEKVYQRPIQDPRKKKTYSNENIMTYLRNCLPQMFGKTLSVLNRPLIQQYLDELCWREKWGVTPLRAFNSMIDHIRNQTALCRGDSLPSRLSKITRNPFMNWQYSNWDANFNRVERKTKKRMSVGLVQSNWFLNDNSTLLSSCVVNTSDDIINSVQKLNPHNYKPIPTELVSLESYYYGTLPGVKTLSLSERECQMNVKCILCGITVRTNICLMKHIIEHVVLSNTDDTDASWCKYCLKQCSKYKIQKTEHKNHLLCIKHHFKSMYPNTSCLICETDFTFRTKLIVHMHFAHHEMELPYECGVCKFRSSQHHVTVDHFYETHYNGENGQCPICLKIVAFKDNSGLVITRNTYYFLNHLKKHKCKSLVTECDRCVLSFINKGQLQYHKRTHHNSCKDILNIKRCENSTILMPLPEICSPNATITNNEKIVDLPRKCTYTKHNITKMIEKSRRKPTCCECDEYMTAENHLEGEFSCSMCQFKTSCETSMFEHTINFHDRSCTLDYIGNQKILLNNLMCCICGFKSGSGNRLAGHLVRCGKSSAYKYN